MAMNSFKGGSLAAVILVCIDRFFLQGKSEVAVLVVKAVKIKEISHKNLLDMGKVLLT